MTSLGRRIFRERRRVTILGVMAALSGYLLFLGQDDVVLGLSVSTLASMGFALGLIGVSLAVSLTLPGYRFVFEALALMLLITSVVSLFHPLLDVRQSKVSIWLVLFFVVGTQGLYQLFYGRWSDNLLHSRLYIERAVAMTPLDPNDLWLAIFPDPYTREFYFDDSLIEMSALDDRPDALMMVNALGGGLLQEHLLEFDQIERGESFRAVLEPLTPQRDLAAPRPIYAVLIEPREDRVAVHIRWERPFYPARKALMHWIDDWAGRRLDSMIAGAEAKVDALEAALLAE